MVIQRQQGLIGEVSGGGYFVRRSGPISSMTRRNLAITTDNKENIDPLTGQVIRSARQRQSPLPDWYPRIPLKDITALIQAIERRDRRRAEREAASLLEEPSPPPITEQQTPELADQIAPLLTLPPVSLTPEQVYEKMLSESIEKIEKMVRKNMKNDVKKTKAVKRETRVRTLMSMR